MATIKLTGRNVRAIGEEIATLLTLGNAAVAPCRTVRFSLYSYSLSFDLSEAEVVKQTAADAARYWLSRGKRAKSEAAETVRSKVAEVIITESARLSWSK